MIKLQKPKKNQASFVLYMKIIANASLACFV